MDDELLRKYAYVISSTYRVRVIEGLDGEVLIPSKISKKIDLESKFVSKALRELKDKGLVECVNEEYRKGRLYRLTSEGEGVIELLEKYDINAVPEFVLIRAGQPDQVFGSGSYEYWTMNDVILWLQENGIN